MVGKHYMDPSGTQQLLPLCTPQGSVLPSGSSVTHHHESEGRHTRWGVEGPQQFLARVFGSRRFAPAGTLSKNGSMRSQEGTDSGTCPHQPPPASPQDGAIHCLSPHRNAHSSGTLAFPSPTTDFHPHAHQSRRYPATAQA